MTQPPDLPDWHQPAERDGWRDPADTQEVPAVPPSGPPPTVAMPTLPPLSAPPAVASLPATPRPAAAAPARPAPLQPAVPMGLIGPTTGSDGPPPSAFPWPWVLGGLALVVVLAVVIGAMLGSKAGSNATTTSTTIGTAASTTFAAAATTTPTVAITTSTRRATTTTLDPNVEAVSFARRAVAKCAVDHPDDVSAERPNGIKSTGTVDAKARRYGIVDAKGVGLVVDLANQILTSPAGPTGTMPAPYDVCDPVTFVGPRPDVTTTTSTSAP